MVFRQNVLYIYTDGSSLRTPRRGGFAIRFIYVDTNGEDQVQDIESPGHLNATSNQMELKACVFALEEAMRLHLTTGVTRIIIRTDSLYVADNYKKAMFEWSSNRWIRRSGAPVLNADIWKELLKAMKNARVRVEFEWIRGHSRDEHNIAVDRMARRSAQAAARAPLSVVHVRRKLSDKSVERGIVQMRGQRLSIRIISTEYLNVQKIWKLKYEVISRRSDDYMSVDIIFSDALLKAGHSYYVRVNDDTNNPRIVKVFREIESK